MRFAFACTGESGTLGKKNKSQFDFVFPAIGQ